MASREYAWFVEESSYGTPVASPTTGTNAFYARLHQDDAFTAQMNPVLLDIMYGGGRATPALQVYDQYLVPFNFTTYLYSGAYTATLLNWAITPVNAGRTAPWVTTDSALVMPPGDLASLSWYHAIQQPDGTYDMRRYGGAKCLSWNLAASRTEPRLVFSCTGVAIRDDLNAAGSVAYPLVAEFPIPTETQYPINPFLFSQTSSNFFMYNGGSVARAQYQSLGLSCTNAMDPRAFESKYMQLCRFCGRTTSLTASLYLKPSPADLALYQQATVLTASIKFDDGTHTFKIDMLANNFMKSVTRHLALDKVYMRDISAQNFWDATNAGDLVLTTS